MITEHQTQLARVNWVKASEDLDFKLITPYSVFVDGREQEVFAFLPEHGSPNGTFVFLTSPPEYETNNYLRKWADKKGIYRSFINIEGLLEYDIKYFRETLKDWGKFNKTEKYSNKKSKKLQ